MVLKFEKRKLRKYHIFFAVNITRHAIQSYFVRLNVSFRENAFINGIQLLNEKLGFPLLKSWLESFTEIK